MKKFIGLAAVLVFMFAFGTVVMANPNYGPGVQTVVVDDVTATINGNGNSARITVIIDGEAVTFPTRPANNRYNDFVMEDGTVVSVFVRGNSIMSVTATREVEIPEPVGVWEFDRYEIIGTQGHEFAVEDVEVGIENYRRNGNVNTVDVSVGWTLRETWENLLARIYVYSLDGSEKSVYVCEDGYALTEDAYATTDYAVSGSVSWRQNDVQNDAGAYVDTFVSECARVSLSIYFGDNGRPDTAEDLVYEVTVSAPSADDAE